MNHTKMIRFHLPLEKFEPEIIFCQNRKRYRRVLYLQEVSHLQLATSSIAIAFQELNDEGSDTMFRG